MTDQGPNGGGGSLRTIQPKAYIRLYIAGSAPSSLRAQRNLRTAIDIIGRMAMVPDIEIIDVFKGPKRAIADGVFVTPTFVLQVAGKRMMMVGDLSNTAALGSVLDAALAEEH